MSAHSHSINPPSQPILSTYPINPHYINPPSQPTYQSTLSTHPLNPPSQPTLSLHPINPPSHPPITPPSHPPSHPPITPHPITHLSPLGDTKQSTDDDGAVTQGVSSWANKWQDTDTTVNIDQPTDPSLMESDYWPSTTDRYDMNPRTLSCPSFTVLLLSSFHHPFNTLSTPS